MSLGLDALNKLQRERAEDAAIGAGVMLYPAAQTHSSPNRLLAIGFLLSLGVASLALFRNRSGAVGLTRSAEAAPQAAASAAYRAPVTFSVPNLALAAGQNALAAAWVANGRVGGVDLRPGTGLGAVVMFNDSLCHEDDVVNPVFGIRLTRIEAHRLTFQDSRGSVYLKDTAPPGATPSTP